MKKETIRTILVIAVILIGLFTPSTPVVAKPGDTVLISVNSAGIQGDYGGDHSAISADGRFVAFRSSSSNLTPSDTNWWADIYIHDLETGETRLVSVASDGSQGNDLSSAPAISADGRYVAFDSYSNNLVSGDTNGYLDVFVHDMVTGETRRVSVASNSSQGNGNSWFPSLSADGRLVVFSSVATNLVSGDTNGYEDIFVHDLETGETTRISIASDGSQGNDFSDPYHSISADGRYVVFHSMASNLVHGDTNGYRDIFVHDRQTGETRRVSVASDGSQGNAGSIGPTISADGRMVAFHSYADNLTPNDANGYSDVFVHDMQTGETRLVSLDSDGNQGNGFAFESMISANGRIVVFRSSAANLVAGDTNGFTDIFAHDIQTGKTRRVSIASDGSQGDGNAGIPTVSADGKFIAFTSVASNLTPGDTNGGADIFVHETSWDISWVIMFYIAGDLDDGVGESYYHIMNYIEKGAGNEDIRILVLWDQYGFGNSAYYEIKYDEDMFNLADYEEGIDHWDKNELNMGSSTTLSDFLQWGMENYPAANYALVMDDHGAGLGGSMVDETSGNDLLTLAETKLALESTASSYQALDVLVMNACMMGLIESGYQFKDVAGYYVASEDLQRVYYQGYTATLEQITATSNALDVAREFMLGYAEEQIGDNKKYTMSVVDLSQAEAIKYAIEELAGELNQNISENAGKLWEIRENEALKFPSIWVPHSERIYYMDLFHFAELVIENFDDQNIQYAAQNLMGTIYGYVVYNSSSYDNAHGVSIFYPDIKSSYYTGENYDFAVGTNWSAPSGMGIRSDQSSDPIGWGSLLANIFEEVDPGGLDDPNPPEPLPKASYSTIHLPIILVVDLP